MAETKKKNIYETIAAVMADIGAVGKNSKNSQQGFMYRGIDAVMNALAKPMTDNKLFVVPEILEQTREERQTSKGGLLIYSICKVKYTFYAEDGSNVSAVVIGEGMDSGDKATNKAMSVAFKYACFQVFCIPTEEMVDPDAECHEVAPKQPEQTAPKAQPKQAQTQATDDKEHAKLLELQKTFVAYCKEHEIDYHKYGLKQDSPRSAFEDAYAQAIKEVADKAKANEEPQLPFEV